MKKDKFLDAMGDIDEEILQDLSYEALVDKIGIFDNIIDFADSFKVRAWCSQQSYDAIFHAHEDGTITIEKHKV